MRQRIIWCWRWLRALATDDAYERYLEHHRRAHADRPPLTRREFYVRQQQAKWNGVQRCC
jgi:uncharacterized short protein YbdD (DUF466 family)